MNETADSSIVPPPNMHQQRQPQLKPETQPRTSLCDTNGNGAAGNLRQHPVSTASRNYAEGGFGRIDDIGGYEHEMEQPARQPLRLRSYQQSVVDQIDEGDGVTNAIVKMPTGSGKTFVAAELIRLRLRAEKESVAVGLAATVTGGSNAGGNANGYSYSYRQGNGVGSHSNDSSTGSGRKAIMLVPTVDLVEQQASAIERWMGPNERVARYRGGNATPVMDYCRILVSTPAAFEALQGGDDQFHWDTFCICVFDEVHHVLKDHPYRKLSLGIKIHLKDNPHAAQLQVIGLSASLTYAVNNVEIKRALDNLCKDLKITRMCSPTEDELQRGGYVKQQSNVQIIDVHDIPPDVVPVRNREPHNVHAVFMDRVHTRKATSFALILWDAIRLLEEHASNLAPDFHSPLSKIQLSSWENYANNLAGRRRNTESQRHFFSFLEGWYVALRLLVVTWEEEVPLVLKWLEQALLLQPPRELGHPLLGCIGKVADRAKEPSKKLQSLTDILLQQLNRFKGNFRAIIFVQQRICAYTISSFLNKHPALQAAGIVSDFFTRVGKLTPSVKFNPTNANDALNKFRNGSINVLVATAAAEEGLDVPSANVVISYNHMKDTVELCQREGRARQIDRVFIVMEERRDRPVEKLRTVQKRQEEIIVGYDPSTIKDTEIDERGEQAHRDRHAKKILTSKANRTKNATAVLNEYCQKTRGKIKKSVDACPGVQQSFVARLTYETTIRSLNAEGYGTSKKAAQNAASSALLGMLRQAS